MAGMTTKNTFARQLQGPATPGAPDAVGSGAPAKPQSKPALAALVAEREKVAQQLLDVEAELDNSPQRRQARLLSELRVLDYRIDGARQFTQEARRQLSPNVQAQLDQLESEWQVLEGKRCNSGIGPREAQTNLDRQHVVARQIRQLLEEGK
jgi:hypothetical protein